MWILVIISIVTFGLVLWAAISIVQHINISLRRRKFSREQDNATVDGILGLSQPREVPQPPALIQPSPHPAPELAQPIVATTPAPQITEAPYVTPSSIAPRIAALVAILDAAVAEPIASIAPPPRKAATPIPAPVEVIARSLPELSITEYIPDPAPEALPALIAEPIPAAPEILITAAAAHAETTPEITEAIPTRRPPTRSIPSVADIVHQPAAHAAAEPDTEARRPVRSAHPQPSTPFALPTRRPDWLYFNKDMGDLSDPVPSRIRDRRANSR